MLATKFVACPDPVLVKVIVNIPSAQLSMLVGATISELSAADAIDMAEAIIKIKSNTFRATHLSPIDSARFFLALMA
jgi:hypothetical protein